MSELHVFEFVLVGIVFIWSGFVRSGLGFGGAALSLPFLLLIHDEPLVFLPVIAVHLLVFSSWILLESFTNNIQKNDNFTTKPDWKYLVKSLKLMIIPKFIGIMGLLTLPPKVITIFIFIIVAFYSLGYIFNRKFETKKNFLENLFLVIGGYVSGTSLTAAPLIIPVFANNVAKNQLRSTLFVLWFFLVILKLISFIVVGVDLQLIHHIWLFPCALIGHLFGAKLHKRLLQSDTATFYKILGFFLLLTSIIGLLKTGFQ